MAGIFGYSREAIRVKVKKCEGVLQPEHRKFSVDPQITSFEVLQSILAKAFDIRGEFTVSYRTFDDYGQETYLSLLSDWDLDAAFLSASEPNLCLRVDMKPFEETSEDWDVIGCIDVPRNHVPETKPQNRLPGLIMNQMERTLNLVQRALNLVEDQMPVSSQPPRPPLADAEFRRFLDPIGQVVQSDELRNVVYFGGIEPSLRKVVWKHLLNVYPDGMSGRERMDYMKKKAYEYQSLRDCWKEILQSGVVTGDLAFVTSMVRKDVLRTDRHHKFYAGSDDNQNIASLFNILTTYALNHPTVSYCQGMSDLASPLLVTMGDEAHAYICFCALMRRLHSNFLMDGVTMTLKFQHLAEGLLYFDPEFYAYLKSHQADDLLFCYRWLLLEMKREFAFDDALCMLEVLWSALPQQASTNELPLYELQFCPQLEAEDSLAPVSPLVKSAPRENAYTKVCALRRQGSAASLHSTTPSVAPHRFTHRQNQSLDETAARRSNNGVFRAQAKVKPFASLDDTSIKLLNHREARSRSASPFEMVSAPDVDEINNEINKKTTPDIVSASTGNLVTHKQKIAKGKFTSLDKITSQDLDKSVPQTSEKRQGRVVKNLNEFLSFKSNNKFSLNEESDIVPSSKLDCEAARNSLLSKENSRTPLLSMAESSSDESQLAGRASSDKCDDSSPDDSNEYFPMTTSMTRELRLEMENLDRQVFGAKFNQRTLALDDTDSPVSESHRSCDEVTIDSSRNHLHEKSSCEVNSMLAQGQLWQQHSSWHGSNGLDPAPEKAGSGSVVLRLNRSPRHISPATGAGTGAGEDIFVWENPLQYPTTPDEQADLEMDSREISSGEIFENEGEGVKSVTPIRILQREAGIKLPPPPIPDTPNCTTYKALTPVARRRASRDVSPIKSMAFACEEAREKPLANKHAMQLPPLHEFGAGNPFLMFLCLTVLRQHRDFVMRNGMDYNEMAMHFDKMVRKHNVTRVLNQARQMYDMYKKQQSAGLSV